MDVAVNGRPVVVMVISEAVDVAVEDQLPAPGKDVGGRGR